MSFYKINEVVCELNKLRYKDTGHRWSGFPGAYCLDCGTENMTELMLADGEEFDYMLDSHNEIVFTNNLVQEIVQLCDGICIRKVIDGRLHNIVDFDLINEYINYLNNCRNNASKGQSEAFNGTSGNGAATT